MTPESIINIICAIISVLLATFAIYLSIYQFKKTSELQNKIEDREYKRYLEQVDIEARKFITKYNETNEIQLLALCMVAYKYDNVHPYRRTIYKEWCSLRHDVKERILYLRDFDLHSDDIFVGENIFESSLAKLEAIVDFLYDNSYKKMFYDAAKYFRYSINKYKNISEDKANYTIGKWNAMLSCDYTLKSAMIDIIYKNDSEKEIIINKNSKKYRGNTMGLDTFFRNGEEYSASYICVLISIYAPIMFYRNKTLKFENYGYIDDYLVYHDCYLEDLFLYGLLNINLYENNNFSNDEE